MTQKIEEYPVIKQGLVKMTKRNNGFSLRTPTGFMPVMKSDVERDSGAKYVRTFYRNSYRYDIYKFPLVA